MMTVNQHSVDVQQLIGLGLEYDQAERALKRWPDVNTAAINFFEGNLDMPDLTTDDEPPPLIAIDEPPAYDAFGPQNYVETRINTTPTPAKEVALWAPPAGPPPSAGGVIDLTGDDDKGNNSDELARALKLSTETEADDFDKALAMSMSDLRGNDAVGGGAVEAIPAEQRIRTENEPVVLRSASPILGLLASYLQCLYALPTWRKAVLEYRPTQQDLGSRHTFAGLWKGEEGERLQGNKDGTDDAQWGMIALQRLFALMIHTRRSFLHVSEIVKNLPDIDDIARPGTHAVYALSALHNELVERFRKTESEQIVANATAEGLSAEDIQRKQKDAEARFSYHGRQVENNDYMRILPPVPADESDQVAVTELSIPVSSTHPSNLYSAIDEQFVTSSSTNPDAVFALLTTLPDTLLFKLERKVAEVTNLDSFGAEGKKQLFEIVEEVWLDRYWVGNRVKIAEGRKRVRELEKELEGVREKRATLAVTKDGKDGVDLIRQTVGYFEQAISEDVARKERQAKLAEQYRAVLEEMERKVAEYDASIHLLQKRIDHVFDSDEMRKLGPYQLCAILMRNGLNGRGSSWSIVKDVEGRWWKISDLNKEEVKLEDARKDTSGIHMNAGATMLFYQRSDADLELAETPSPLEDLALEDNHVFASELPTSITDAWALPPLRSRTPSPTPVSRSRSATMEAVDDIIPFPEDSSRYSPPAVDVVVPPPTSDADMDSPTPEVRVGEEGSNKMVVDEEIEHLETVPSLSAEEEAMRLRGGAGEEEEEEEEEGSDYDDEEFDEDEVELGCLEPMPESWDVDFAVGKVGGLPAYLDPTSPLEPKDVECGVCRGTMSLLLQVNSPDDQRAHAAARALYVYACRSKDCFTNDSKKAAKLLRVQMPSPNAFFPHTEETQAKRKALEEALAPTLGLSGPLSSSSVKAWPEWDIACESEPYEESYLPNPIDKSTEDGANGEDAAEPDTRTGVDTAFLAFQDRIERVPEQVLRFYRLPGVEDPQPLWANNKKIEASAVPPCSLCGGPRQIEFQVVSTILNSLKDDFSFDSLLAYTCIDNCPIPAREEGKTGWVEECLVEDLFDEAGVHFGQG